jgi:hypothetical protein
MMMAKRSSSLTADYIPAMISSTLITRVTIFPSGFHFLGAGSVDDAWSLAVLVSGFATVTTATGAYILLDVTTSGTQNCIQWALAGHIPASFPVKIYP